MWQTLLATLSKWGLTKFWKWLTSTIPKAIKKKKKKKKIKTETDIQEGIRIKLLELNKNLRYFKKQNQPIPKEMLDERDRLQQDLIDISGRINSGFFG